MEPTRRDDRPLCGGGAPCAHRGLPASRRKSRLPFLIVIPDREPGGQRKECQKSDGRSCPCSCRPTRNATIEAGARVPHSESSPQREFPGGTRGGRRRAQRLATHRRQHRTGSPRRTQSALARCLETCLASGCGRGAAGLPCLRPSCAVCRCIATRCVRRARGATPTPCMAIVAGRQVGVNGPRSVYFYSSAPP